MMKFHKITGGRPRIESVVTLPESVAQAVAGQSVIDRFYDGYSWYCTRGGYTLGRTNPVLIAFSDGTLGSCPESALEAALAEYDVSIAEPATDSGALAA